MDRTETSENLSMQIYYIYILYIITILSEFLSHFSGFQLGRERIHPLPASHSLNYSDWFLVYPGCEAHVRAEPTTPLLWHVPRCSPLSNHRQCQNQKHML